MTLVLFDDDLTLAGDRPAATAATPFGAVAYAEVTTPDDSGGLFILERRAVDPRALAYAARDLGGARVLALVRAGAAAAQPVDYIEFTSGRPTTFFSHIGTGYVQQAPPFCPELGAALTAAGVPTDGILLVLSAAPNPAAAAFWDAQGIAAWTTAVQPAGALCRELELCWAVVTGAATLDLRFWQAVAAALPARGCSCDQSMAFARRAGRLDPDWRRWPAPVL